MPFSSLGNFARSRHLWRAHIKSNVVYKITCPLGSAKYVGQRQRHLQKRFNEHDRASTPVGNISRSVLACRRVYAITRKYWTQSDIIKITHIRSNLHCETENNPEQQVGIQATPPDVALVKCILCSNWVYVSNSCFESVDLLNFINCMFFRTDDDIIIERCCQNTFQIRNVRRMILVQK